jgi:integrase/recombinase XerD
MYTPLRRAAPSPRKRPRSIVWGEQKVTAFTDVYHRWLRAARYKPDTIARAVQITKSYLTFCAARQLEPFSREGAEEYLADAGQRVRPHTHLNYWKDLRMAFAFAVTQGLAARNWVEQIPKPRPSLYEREKDVYYTEAEFRQLVAVCPRWSWVGQRDAAILHVLRSCGFRASELCNLLVTDVDWEEDTIHIQDGKGGARYRGLMSEECALILRSYTLNRPHDIARLFTDIHGGPFTRHALEQMIRRLARRGGFPTGRIFPHGFRHSFRVDNREMGLDDADIAALLGHKTVRSTWAYARRQASRQAIERLRAKRAS